MTHGLMTKMNTVTCTRLAHANSTYALSVTSVTKRLARAWVVVDPV